MEKTADRTGLLFNIALNYGGRTEITDAVRRLATDVAAGPATRPPRREHAVGPTLHRGPPDPDLLIPPAASCG